MTDTSAQQEAERLQALHETGLLDTPASEDFDQLTELCRLLFEVPIVAVSLVDKSRQWFKSQVGLDACETGRDVAFCAHVVAANEPIEVEDATQDPRFAHNPLVTDEPNIRFYSGFPIFSQSGHVLGTLCLIDTKSRRLSDKERQLQYLLTRQAEVLVRRHQEQAALELTRTRIEEQDKLLEVLLTGLTDYSALMSGDRLWTFLEQALRDLTNSDYALIGECLPGTQKLKIHAITDLSWDEPSRRLLEQLRIGQMTLSNPNTMLGQVFAQGHVVITNDFASDERRGGQPEGHPALHNYAGVPIVDGDEILGMFGIANSSAMLCNETVERLKPFTATCALLIKLYRQLEERERANHELQQAKDTAEQANRAKNDFLSSMSHELRTPLNSVLGYAQLLVNSRKQPLADRQRDQVEQIYKSGQHLLSLINEVLDLAKIEAGQIPLSIESIALQDVAGEAIDTLRTIASDRGVTMRFDKSALTPVQVAADYTRLKQVLINLLSNAIKYNREGGFVHLAWKVSERQVVLVVEDNGIGIDASKQDQLFQPFNRLGAENSSIEGTGVGLSITKTLVELMEGRIEVTSEQGKGSQFAVTLPLSDESYVSNGAAQASEQAPANEMTVIYIEDNPANQRLMEDVFNELSGVDLICANNAYLGIQLARRHQPQLLLMDINLPDLDGYAALRQMQLDTALAAIPVAALSANVQPRDIEKGLAAGFTAYLTKPLDINALFDLLKQVEVMDDE